ncbi:hypothetical protein TeGR_g2362, partial [Tetraparma gracilis]
FDAVSAEYSTAVAKGMLDYALLSPAFAAEAGISLPHLHAAPVWWTDRTYQSPSWTILRETGVSVAAVHRSFVAVSARLCTCEDVMLDLQTLWKLSRLPQDWDVGALGEEDRPPTYAELSFTNVGKREFRSKLPLTIEHFAGGVEKTANAVREALRECWVSAAASILGRHTADMSDEPAAAPGAPAPPGPGQDLNQPSVDGSVESLDSGLQYDQWEQSAYGEKQRQGRALLDERVAAENLDGALPPLPPDGGEPAPAASRKQGIFDAAATLMSRQLRESTADSLVTFKDFFCKFDHPDDSGDSAFKLSLVMNPDFSGLKKTDPEYDPSAPREPVVVLEPSAEQVKELACGCIDQIVDSAARFPRPDAAGAGPAGPNLAPLGPCTVTEDDEIVNEVKADICAAIDKHYEMPAKLIELFDEFEVLLSGEK